MSDNVFAPAVSALTRDMQMHDDFIALCECGGRRAGSDSERAALELVHSRMASIDHRAQVEPVEYAGWRCSQAAFTLNGDKLICNPLLGSASTTPEGISAEVIDLGRGALEDFERSARYIPGKFVLVRHEYPFSASHIHRRRKYGWAMERGAAGFVIANPLPGAGPMSGSSGRGGMAGIPAVSVDFESAARLTAAHGSQRAHLLIRGEDYAARTSVVTLDFPGQTQSCVALSAHVDGHDLAQSAMDNATGVAVVLAVTRAFAPLVANGRRGLKVCLFSAEEWALAGSRQYLDSMAEHDRAAIAVNINLDTVGGDSDLTALTSEFPLLVPFVRHAAESVGMALNTYEPMMSNSDHYNFARHGIPALRLVAGFDRPESNIKYILTRSDTRDKVDISHLRSAAMMTAALLGRALTASDADMASLRQR